MREGRLPVAFSLVAGFEGKRRKEKKQKSVGEALSHFLLTRPRKREGRRGKKPFTPLSLFPRPHAERGEVLKKKRGGEARQEPHVFSFPPTLGKGSTRKGKREEESNQKKKRGGGKRAWAAATFLLPLLPPFTGEREKKTTTERGGGGKYAAIPISPLNSARKVIRGERGSGGGGKRPFSLR